MRPLVYVFTVLGIMGLAFWAYRENYATQRALRQLSSLQSEIGDLREALSVQRAEWAYLNRPERLRDLTALNFDRLSLLPMEPGQFQAVSNVALPPPPLPEPALVPTDVQGELPPVEGADQ